jgi:PIN domain nuclease of toxin-antitoxin system
MISHLLDTCAFLDLAAGRWTDRTARNELMNARYPAVLCVSVWEIARKLRVGKLKLPCAQAEVLEFVHDVCHRHQLHLEPLMPEICHAAELLPAHHEDPFDRMILALAFQSQCPVFTTDKHFKAYPVRVMATH